MLLAGIIYTQFVLVYLYHFIKQIDEQIRFYLELFHQPINYRLQLFFLNLLNLR